MAESIVRLKVESSEYDSKLKRASEGLTRYIEGCRKAGGTLEVVEADTLKYVQALGQMETKSTTAKGRLNEMTKAYTDLRVQFNHLTAEEKSSQFGQAMSASLEQLKTRINNAKTELSNIGREIGESSTNFAGLKVESASLKDVFASLGSQFGVNSELMGVVTTGTIGMTAAITGGIAAVTAATKAWVDYNLELEKRDTDASVITGTNGEEAKKIADAAKAMSDVYNVDFREALNGVNTLMQQFGVTSDDAIQLVRDGLQGMLEGDGPKLLQMIQQFAPAFRDAGISADQLVAIIHNSEGGIFTDANMNAIVMGIKNIRLMTNSTSEALAKIGVNGDEITQKLKNGTMTIFDAMKLILTALQQTNAGSQEAGEVMQQVFGRQGTAVGTNLAKAINTLNLNLDETKNQTGGVGENLAMLEQKNERLQQAFRKAFGTEGVEDFIAEIKGDLIDSLADALEHSDALKDGTLFLASAIKAVVETAVKFVQIVGTVYDVVNGVLSPITNFASGLFSVQEGFDKADSSPLVTAVKSLFSPVGILLNQLRGLLGLINKAKAALDAGSADTYIKNHPGSDKAPAPRKATAGAEINSAYFADADTYKNSRYGSAGSDGKWRFNDYGARVWNQNHPNVGSNSPRDAEGLAPGHRRYFGKAGSKGGPGWYTRQYNSQTGVWSWQPEANTPVHNRNNNNNNNRGGGSRNTNRRGGSGRNRTRTNRTTPRSTVTKSEEQLNSEAIKKYEGEYRTLQDERIKAESSGNNKAVAQIDGRSHAIQLEIAALQKRNEQLKGWDEEALGKNTEAPEGSLKKLNEEMSDFKKNQDLSTTHEQWQKWQNDIDGVQKKIDDINGKSSKKDFSSLTSSNISGYISSLQQQLSQVTVGGLDYSKLLDKEAFATAFQNLLKEGLQDGADYTDIDAEGLWQKILSGDDPEGVKTALAFMLGQINDARGFKGLGGMSLDSSGGLQEMEKPDEQDGMKSVTEKADRAIGAMSQLTGGLQSMGIKIPDGVTKLINFGQGLIQVIQSVQALISIFSTSTVAMQTSSIGLNTAALIANTTALGANSATNFIPFARGGIVRAAGGHMFGGNNFSGDLIPAAVNSGELILNRAQQGNVASQLEGMGTLNNLSLSTEVNGETLRFVLNANGRRTGRGEMVTSNIKLW